MKKHQIDKSTWKYVLFIISPIVSFVFSLGSIQTVSSRKIFFMFAIVFALALTIDPFSTMDGARYRERFEEMTYVSVEDFTERLNLYLHGMGDKDFYSTVVSFLVSRFTNNYHVFFAVCMVVFIVFMLKSLALLTNEKRFNNTWYAFFIVFIFVSWNTIFNVQYVRFYTAAWIAVYALLKCFIFRQHRYAFLLIVATLIHLSLFILVILYALNSLSFKYRKCWVFIYILSFVLSFISKSQISNLMESHLPQIFSSAFSNYLTDEAANRIWGFGFIQEFFRLYLEPIYMNILMLVSYYSLHRQSNYRSKYLLSFLLVYMTFVNMSIQIPTLGTRFLQMAIPLFAYLILIESKHMQKVKYIVLFYPVAFAFTLFVTGRYYTMVTELKDYVQPPLITIYDKL